MATFTERTHLLAALLVIISAVIMSFSVDVCHGARDGAGTFSWTEPAERPGYNGRRDPGPYSYGPLYPGRPVCISGHCPTPYFPRPYPYPRTPPSPAPEKGEIPPP
uniref:Uncharacterized protein n=1 Tax=Leersia perrieri TaxID=77586 RepID=A0A0D9WRP3_9ORYZ